VLPALIVISDQGNYVIPRTQRETPGKPSTFSCSAIYMELFTILCLQLPKFCPFFYLNLMLTFLILHSVTDRICYVYVGLCIVYGISEPWMQDGGALVNLDDMII